MRDCDSKCETRAIVATLKVFCIAVVIACIGFIIAAW